MKKIKVRETTEVKPPDIDPAFYEYKPDLKKINGKGDDNIKLVVQSKKITEEAKNIIEKAHSQFHQVFNKDLSQGYNSFYGKHECHLNWASSERPQGSKVRVPNYDHDLKGLQQELMDQLTDQKVLLIPQDHNIKVQSVCPSFIQRKQRVKDKPKNLLTKDDVRLLINFGPVNDKIKPLPIHVPKTDEHMSKQAIPWLGVQTPFGGLRVIARSGQGLLGMAEEFDELLSKVLKEELKAEKCCKIVDDIYVGGQTQKEAAENYAQILNKLHKANLKITAEKTKIFPTSANVLGWIWKEGGFLEASPHKKTSVDKHPNK